MEGYIYKWLNIISGFKPRYAVIKDGKLELSASKDDPNKKFYDLSSSKIIEDKKQNHFSIELNGKKISFKTYSEYERSQWIKALYQEQLGTKEKEMIEKKFEMEIETDKDLHKVMCDSLYNIQNNVFELNIAINTLHSYLQTGKGKKDVTLLNLYEQFLTIKQNLRNNVDDTIKSVVEFNAKYCRKSVSQKSEVFYEAQDMSDSFNKAKYRLERISNSNDGSNNFSKDIKQLGNNNDNINNINSNVIDQSKANDRPQSSKKKKEKSRDYTKDDQTSDNDSSFEDCEDLANTEITFGDIENKKLEKQISLKKSDFELFGNNFSAYFFDKRTKLPTLLKSSNSMISDMVKSAMKEKASLPITYNEPLSMLQRQIESFQFYYLLEKVYSEKEIELKYANIAGFVVSEISLNINRLLKPFNPILGETYEYVDINYKYRSFSEQVSHHPPISAFILESKNITVYGDSKSKHKFQFLKGAMEMTFNTKTHVLVHSSVITPPTDLKKKLYSEDYIKDSKESKDKITDKNMEDSKSESHILHHFTFGKPVFYFKGLVYGTPHYDFVGKISIEDIHKHTDNNNSNSTNNKTNNIYRAELEFLDESKKKLGDVEGKIFKNKEVVYTLKGNWKEGLWLYSKDGKEMIKEIWKLDNEEPYIINKDTINNYLISTYANNLNYLPDVLKGELPVSDSRFRPDQRQLELGNIELGEELKKLLEEKQRKRAKDMEANKQVYKPMYFEVAGDESGSFYVPVRDYWKDRQSKNLDHIHNVFNLDQE